MKQGTSYEAFARSVHVTLEKAQSVLAQAGTSPQGFTLHDSGHSYRVAELMADILEPGSLEAFSCYEVGLLLMSAYLHDIGMTPPAPFVENIWNFIGFGAEIDESEKDRLLAWLDDNSQIDTLPILGERGSTEGRRTVDLLTSHYIRHRHNDLSEIWIRRNLTSSDFGTYASIIEDIICLCRSHHEGLASLTTTRYDATLVGNPATALNLRFLAAVLRMADVLEIDPERTPDIIYLYRSIPRSSRVYWAKDHGVSPLIEPTAVTIAARPKSAVLHQAINETIDQIDCELVTCSTLATQGHFQRGVAGSSTAYRWTLPTAAIRDIQPLDRAYVFINGAFRPNTKKLLQLLGGSQLYGSTPLVAVRELLQNSFDAVRERVALDRLRQSDASDARWDAKIGAVYNVDLRLEERSDEDGRSWWLVCEDQGVGMTRYVIESYVLVSGQPKQHTVRDLERRCLAAGFQLERTGQFGIGVLSFFLLGNVVEFETRRTSDYGDSEPTAWKFVTEGVGSFGELTQSKQQRVGTTTSIRLRSELVGDSASFAAELEAYLIQTVIRTPCNFTFRVGTDSPSINFEPGWTVGSETVKHALNSAARGLLEEQTPEYTAWGVPAELVIEDRVRQIDALQRDSQDTLALFQDRLRIIGTHEGLLPSGKGRYLAVACAFYQKIGESLALFKEPDQGDNAVLSYSTLSGPLCPFLQPKLSWKGMSIAEEQATLGSMLNCQVYLDLFGVDAASLNVHRNSLTLERSTRREIRGAFASVAEWQWNLVAQLQGSMEALNGMMLDSEVAPRSVCWPMREPENIWKMKELSSELMRDSDVAWLYPNRPKLIYEVTCEARKIDVVPTISTVWREGGRGVEWRPHWPVGIRSVLISSPGSKHQAIVPVYEVGSQMVSRPFANGVLAEMPEEWRDVVCITGHVWMWNPKNYLVELVLASGMDLFNADEVVSMAQNDSFASLPSKAEGAKWLLSLIAATNLSMLYEGLLEKKSVLLDRLYRTIWGDVPPRKQFQLDATAKDGQFLAWEFAAPSLGHGGALSSPATASPSDRWRAEVKIIWTE